MNFDTIGEMALGSRLRTVADKVTEDAQNIYDLYGVNLKPKWFPVFYFLSTEDKGVSITSIANAIGQSHPSVIKIVREMLKDRLVREQKDKSDGRINNICLTQKGKAVAMKMENQCRDVESAIKKALGKTNHNLWLALQEFEYLLNEESLYSRVLEQKKIRESHHIKIVDYLPEHLSAFKTLNEEWITTYFKIEEADRKALDNPKKNILDKGGKILVALEGDAVLGVCALLKMEDDKYDYELAKMAVSSNARGKGIGYLLGNAVIERARTLGATTIYLESNTILKPAISLYQKLGFKKVVGHYTPYERCNIQMELKLQG